MSEVLSGEQKRSWIDTANRIRLLAEQYLGDSRREWVERSYASAIDVIHRGDGSGAIKGLRAAVETAASDTGNEMLSAKLSSEIASLFPSR
ncbi:MAG: hypothetical protein KY432_04430 [Acidobacteria bacterium]|nr:hypothetical protein [Acidobacteriota bacterium]